MLLLFRLIEFRRRPPTHSPISSPPNVALCPQLLLHFVSLAIRTPFEVVVLLLRFPISGSATAITFRRHASVPPFALAFLLGREATKASPVTAFAVSARSACLSAEASRSHGHRSDPLRPRRRLYLETRARQRGTAAVTVSKRTKSCRFAEFAERHSVSTRIKNISTSFTVIYIALYDFSEKCLETGSETGAGALGNEFRNEKR